MSQTPARPDFNGPYTAEFGAVHHENTPGFLFTVDPAPSAIDVARALNAELAAIELLTVCEAVEDHCKRCGPADEGQALRRRMQAAIAKARR